MNTLTLSDWWNHYVADPNVLMFLNISLSAFSLILLIFSVWEAVAPPRIHDNPAQEHRWQILRRLLAFSVSVFVVMFGLAGWLESDRVGTSVRSLVKNSATLLLVVTLLLHAIMRRADAMKRQAGQA